MADKVQPAGWTYLCKFKGVTQYVGPLYKKHSTASKRAEEMTAGGGVSGTGVSYVVAPLLLGQEETDWKDE